MKTWKLLLAAMMALVMLFAVSALAEECNHPKVDESSWTLTEEPTCDKEGTETAYCESCQQTLTRTVPAMGHKYGDYETRVKPTCTAEGLEARVCMRSGCGNEDARPIAMLEHDYVLDPDSVVEATCTEDGKETFVCKLCGEAFYTEEIPATGHDWKIDQPAVAATCTEDGVTAVEECMVCGYKEGGEVVPATGHTVTTWEVVTKPTCTQPGLDKGVCDVCGEKVTCEVEATGHAWVLDEEFPAKEATCTEDGRTEQYYCPYCWAVQGGEVIPATGHTYLPDESSIVAATCTEIGKVTYVCAYCGDFYTEEIPAIGHDYKVDESAIVEPTCTQVGKETYVCQNCGDFYTVEIPMVEHSWGKWVTIKEATEDEAGLQERTCSVCGATQTREIGTMPETGVATVPTAALVSLMVLAMGSYVVLKKKESC